MNSYFVEVVRVESTLWKQRYLMHRALLNLTLPEIIERQFLQQLLGLISSDYRSHNFLILSFLWDVWGVCCSCEGFIQTVNRSLWSLTFIDRKQNTTTLRSRDIDVDFLSRSGKSDRSQGDRSEWLSVRWLQYSSIDLSAARPWGSRVWQFAVRKWTSQRELTILPQYGIDLLTER